MQLWRLAPDLQAAFPCPSFAQRFSQFYPPLGLFSWPLGTFALLSPNRVASGEDFRGARAVSGPTVVELSAPFPFLLLLLLLIPREKLSEVQE